MKTSILISVIALFGLWEVNANTYYSISSNQWSTTSGAPCVCGPNMNGNNSNFEDTLYIHHEMSIPVLELNGLIVISNQGHLISTGSMQINSTGEVRLENGGVFTANTSVQLHDIIGGTGTFYIEQHELYPYVLRKQQLHTWKFRKHWQTHGRKRRPFQRG